MVESIWFPTRQPNHVTGAKFCLGSLRKCTCRSARRNYSQSSWVWPPSSPRSKAKKSLCTVTIKVQRLALVDQHAGCLAGLSVAVQGVLTRFRRLLDDRLYSKSQEELEDQLSKVGQSWDVLIEQSEIEIARLVQNEWKRRMGHRALVAWSLHREPISSE